MLAEKYTSGPSETASVQYLMHRDKEWSGTLSSDLWGMFWVDCLKHYLLKRELSESIKEGRKAQSQKGSWYPEESRWACESLAFKGMQNYACGKLEDVVFTLKVVPMIVRILWLYYVREFSSIHFFLNVQVPKNFVSLKSGLYRIDIAESLTKEWERGSFTPYSELTFDNN